MLAQWQRWRRRRRHRQLAWRTLRDLFCHRSRLQGTSLRSSQGGRADLVEFKVVEEELVWLRFTILRHPRPYPFSRQFHEVMQLYHYEVSGQRLTHLRSLNLTRKHGRDGEPTRF